MKTPLFFLLSLSLFTAGVKAAPKDPYKQVIKELRAFSAPTLGHLSPSVLPLKKRSISSPDLRKKNKIISSIKTIPNKMKCLVQNNFEQLHTSSQTFKEAMLSYLASKRPLPLETTKSLMFKMCYMTYQEKLLDALADSDNKTIKEGVFRISSNRENKDKFYKEWKKHLKDPKSCDKALNFKFLVQENKIDFLSNILKEITPDTEEGYILLNNLLQTALKIKTIQQQNGIDNIMKMDQVGIENLLSMKRQTINFISNQKR